MRSLTPPQPGEQATDEPSPALWSSLIGFAAQANLQPAHSASYNYRLNPVWLMQITLKEVPFGSNTGGHAVALTRAGRAA